MSNFQINVEWLEKDELLPVEFRATFARLTMLIEKEVITRTQDREHIFVPVYPFAEWVVSHWWHLFYESEKDNIVDIANYNNRHNTQFAGQGYAYPNLAIQSYGQAVWLEWEAGLAFATDRYFQSTGKRLIKSDDLKQTFTNLIRQTIVRLEETGINDTILQESWQAITATEADSDEQRFCQQAAALGLYPYDIEEVQANLIIKSWEDLADFSETVRHELFQTTTIDTLARDVASLIQVKKANTYQQSIASDLPQIKAKLKFRLDSNGNPWDQAYELARKTRKIWKDRAWEHENYTLPWIDAAESVKLVRLTNEDKLPIFVAGPQKPVIKRFALLRGVADYLVAETQQPISLVTDAYTYQQRFNRAFAAEFLAPSEDIKKQLGNLGQINSEKIDAIASELNVSSAVVRHQIENHQLAVIKG